MIVPKRIVVGNYAALMGSGLDFWQFQLVIAVDAIEVLADDGVRLIGATSNARMLGLLPINQRPARSDEAQIRGVFGFSEVVIPDHGCKALSVEVSSKTITGGNHLPPDIEGVDLYRRAMSHNDAVNDQIAAMARRLHRPRRWERDRTLASIVRRRRIKRVAVLVRNIEHAVSLARRLQGWRIEARDVNTLGMTATDRKALATAMTATGTNIPTIVTLAAIDQIDPRRFDVLVRADAGKELPPFPTNMLSQPAKNNHRLCLLDLADKRHHELGRATRSRRRAYRQAGWYPPGADPLQERVKDFLAARPSARRN